MPSKNLTIRVKEKDQVIINALLKLNKKNFFPINVDNRTALITLLIENVGQKLLDAAHEGRNFNQEINNRLYLTSQDLNSIHLIEANTKQIMYMVSSLMDDNIDNHLTEQQLKDVSPMHSPKQHNKLLSNITSYFKKKEDEQNE